MRFLERNKKKIKLLSGFRQPLGQQFAFFFNIHYFLGTSYRYVLPNI
jgi:hypothetical protein